MSIKEFGWNMVQKHGQWVNHPFLGLGEERRLQSPIFTAKLTNDDLKWAVDHKASPNL